jgi:hypothetical protein
MNVEKKEVMVFNFADPCQEFVFEGDTIERVQTFKYLGILLESTLNLDNVVECLATTNRRSLFTLNCRYAELCIMDVKLHVTFSTRWCIPQQYMHVKFGWIPRK